MSRRTLYYWFLAARPKTLAAGAVPVLVGSALAAQAGTFKLLPAFLCFMFALFAQIAANISNDYFDFVRQTDTPERQGPKRAAASGWIKPKHLLIGTFFCLVIACGFGLGLIPFGGWHLIIVGIVSVIFCLLYTGGPVPLAYIGLGDLLVVLFFGLVPVLYTAYVQGARWNIGIWLIALALGLAVDNILVANNYRDRDSDRTAGKYTTIVLFGPIFGRCLYLFNGVSAAILTIVYFHLCGFEFWKDIFPLLYLSFHLRAWRLLGRLQGADLNRVLEAGAKNLIVYGLLFLIAVLT